MCSTGPKRAFLTLSLFFAAIILTSCSAGLLQSNAPASSPATTSPAAPAPAAAHTHLALADLGNCRVLLYDAPFTTDQSATVVLGQTGFSAQTNCGQNTESSASSIGPEGLAVDASGNLYVADPNYCRVVMYHPPFTTGMNASLVLGQTSFSTPQGNCSTIGAAGMMFPSGVAIDSHGDVWVADKQANRVTEYAPPLSNGMAATVVLGQTTLDGTYCNNQPPSTQQAPATSTTMCSPDALAFDAHGNLWVGDMQNSRVLEFKPPFTTGMAAATIIGQPSSPNSGVGFPSALAFDTGGNLWVADTLNYRVVEFAPPFQSGMAASMEIGEPGFITSAPQSINFQATPSNLNAPSGLAFDADGNLIVTTSANSRALIFAPPFSNGMSATAVIGQPNLTTGGYDGCAAPAANTLCTPWAALTY